MQAYPALIDKTENMSDIKCGALWALAGLAIGCFAFSLRYWVFESAILSYNPAAK